jgi:hypothetical protein
MNLHDEAKKFREMKIKEVLFNPYPKETDLAFLESWSKMFRNPKLKELLILKNGRRKNN